MVKGLTQYVVTRVLVLLVLCCLSAPGMVVAQIVGIEQLSGVHIDAFPKYPSAGEKVSLRARSSGVDLRGALITWYMNGEVVQESRGGSTFEYVAGGPGDAAQVTVTVQAPEGRVLKSSITQRIQDVIVLWEGDTYTPPLYSGRALHSPGSAVRVQAIAHVLREDGTPYDPNDLIFSWAYGGSGVPFAGGAGMTSVVVENREPYQPLVVVLSIKDLSGNILTMVRTEIPVVQPTIVFYAADPLMGVRYNRSISRDFFMQGAEQSMYAEPYHMIAGSRGDGALSYEWRVGGQRLSTPGSIVLRPEGAGVGTARVGLVIRNTNHWAQRVQADTLVRFNSSMETSSSDVETEAL